ncbi:hypothetical protein [Methanothrix soehngenii]|uniref:hypothetical protein n=1 Tax=Methanothrix soehngenii TaxID=2223 RepID=UPI00300D4F0B
MDIHGPNSGAETATRFLARTLAELGEKIVVAAQIIGAEETIDGVEYWDLGPDFDTQGALARMSERGSYYLISAGRAQPLLESRRDSHCLSRILISHDRSGNDIGIKPQVLCRVLDYVVCVSDAQREVFLKAGAGGIPAKVVTLFNGVSLNLFSGTPGAAELSEACFRGSAC